MELSIIIPVYNAAQTLERCVNSLLGQPLPECEILLVNDGSTDESAALCSRLAADPRIRAVHKANGGASSARNAGLDAAGGRYIHFVDADDTVDSGLYETLLPVMEAEHLDAVLFACHEPDSETPLDALPDTAARLCDLPKEFLAESILSKSVFSAPYNKIFSAEALRQSGVRFDEHLTVNEDFRFNLQFFARAGRLRLTPKAWYCYYSDNAASLSRGFRTDLWESARYNRDAVEGFAKAAGLDAAETVERYEAACAVRQFYLLVGRPGPSDKRTAALQSLLNDDKARAVILAALQKDPNRLPATVLALPVRLRAARALNALIAHKHPG